MKILVTGANGFIGKALVPQLVSLGHVLVPAVRRPCGLNVEHVVMDEASCRVALTGCDCVVHLAGRAHVMREQDIDPLQAFRTANVDATLALANLAVEAGARRFVFISSIKVNGERTAAGKRFRPDDYVAPKDPYGISKWEAEQGLHKIAETTGLEVVIIRPPLVYGPGVKANFAALMRVAKSGIPLPLGAIHNKRSLVSLGNLVEFIITCTSHPAAANQTFLVSDGHDVSTSDLLRGMARAGNVPARLLPIPVSWLRMAGLLLGRKSAIDRLCSNLQVDDSKARTLLGWVPPLTVDEGLSRVQR